MSGAMPEPAPAKRGRKSKPHTRVTLTLANDVVLAAEDHRSPERKTFTSALEDLVRRGKRKS